MLPGYQVVFIKNLKTLSNDKALRFELWSGSCGMLRLLHNMVNTSGNNIYNSCFITLACISSLHSMYVHFRTYTAPSVCTHCHVLHLTSNSYSGTPLHPHHSCWQLCSTKLTIFRTSNWRADYIFFYIYYIGSTTYTHVCYQWYTLHIYRILFPFPINSRFVCREYYTL